MDSALKTLDFGNEAADDVDPEELASYFVEQDSFTAVLNSRKKLLIATAIQPRINNRTYCEIHNVGP
jgi:hypothetical protein